MFGSKQGKQERLGQYEELLVGGGGADGGSNRGEAGRAAVDRAA